MTDTALTASHVAARAMPRLRLRVGEPWLYLAPALAVVVIWTYVPLLQAFELSFYHWNMLPRSQPRYVGFENYFNLLTLPDMRQAVINTILYTVGLLPLSVGVPLAVALLTARLGGPLRNFYRALIFVPMIVAPIVAAITWRWLLNEDHGPVNAWLRGLGFDTVGFLRDPEVALWTLVWITGWKLTGFSTLLFAAADSAINPSYIEAARMDGASPWQIIRDIRLPLLSPTILLLSMMTILFGAQWSFVYINALTGGGPLRSTTNVYFLMWEYGFKTMAAGWSTAAGVLVFIAFGLVALVCLALMKRLAVMTNNAWQGRVGAHTVMIGLSVLAVFPVYWMVQTSFRPESEVFSTGLWPSALTLDNYRDVMAVMPIVAILWNTFVMAAATTLAQVTTGLLAAWALVRWRFPGGRLAHSLIALSWLVPFQVVMIPNYVLATKLGLLDTLTGLVVPNAAAAFAVLVLYNAMRGFPREVVEAARMDGAGSFRTLVQVVIPNLRAPIASISILCFISAWNDYFWPLLLIRKIENSVVQIGLQFFMTQEGNDWGLLMAAATLASLPILIIYLVLQRQVVESFMKSGIR